MKARKGDTRRDSLQTRREVRSFPVKRKKKKSFRLPHRAQKALPGLWEVVVPKLPHWWSCHACSFTENSQGGREEAQLQQGCGVPQRTALVF
jgi:hypothetical protein